MKPKKENRGVSKQGTKSNKILLFLHIAAWAVLLFVPLLLLTMEKSPDKFFIWRFVTRMLIFAILFYANYFLLIPRLLFGKKGISYFVVVSTLIALLYLVNHKVIVAISDRPAFKTQREEYAKITKELKINPKRPWKMDIYNYVFTSILISGFSIGLRMTARYYENEKQRKEMEKEMLNSELAFLKNQVSPHFFFNTLNNIYSLVAINTDDAQKAILQLSKLMRYMLYESEQGNTLLNTEIEFMQNYIELMKLRLNTSVDLIVKMPKNNSNRQVPPLLFIPFIENAFKHGISYQEKSFIHIELLEMNDKLIFTCKNSQGKTNDNVSKENSGIGLENVKKRLALIFPQKHNLDVKNDESSFDIHLEIDFL